MSNDALRSGVGFEDMIKMDDLSEGAMLENLKQRFMQKQIYTFTGAILVSVNPFERLPIYTTSIVKSYVGQTLGDRPPHVFAIAEDAYTDMRDNNANQSMVISGESGAGKTEATKLILQYLATMTAQHSTVEQMILESSPILEAFGNAKTVRNDNSSRFGKYMKVLFSKQGHIAGATMVQYLLEKSRVVSQGEGERNYHIFYQMMTGLEGDLRKACKLRDDPLSYKYLSKGGDPSIKGMDDKEEYERVRMAMNFLGMESTTQESLFRALSAVLHLGELEIKSDGKEGSVIGNPDMLQTVAGLIKVDPNALGKALTVKGRVVAGDTIFSPLKPQEAADTRDAFAKMLYSKMFDWLFDKINAVIAENTGENSTFIGILDIFGFENFKVNSFEQFCINFANEKLQNLFNRSIFQQELEEYEKEKLDVMKVSFVDNQGCLDLIEKTRPPGILSLLDEESRFPKASDQTFLDKICAAHAKNDFFEKPKRSRTSYIVKHYAGEVEYQTEGYLEKNRDALQAELVNLVKRSGDDFVASLKFQSADAGGGGGRGGRGGRGGGRPGGGGGAKKALTVGGTFKASLAELMIALTSSTPHYIRCVKPNSLKVAENFDDDMVMAQLRYAGMMETVRIRKHGYPVRFVGDEFVRKYRVLAPGQKGATALDTAKMILEAAGIEEDLWQVGVTKVFMRDSATSTLTAKRNEALKASVLKIQSWWRMLFVRQYYVWYRGEIVKCQAGARMWYYSRQYRHTKYAALMAQSLWRMIKTRRWFKPELEKYRAEQAKKRAAEEEKRRKEAEAAAKKKAAEEEKRRKEAEAQAAKDAKAAKKAEKKGAPAPAPAPAADSLAPPSGDDGADSPFTKKRRPSNLDTLVRPDMAALQAEGSGEGDDAGSRQSLDEIAKLRGLVSGMGDIGDISNSILESDTSTDRTVEVSTEDAPSALPKPTQDAQFGTISRKKRLSGLMKGGAFMVEDGDLSGMGNMTMRNKYGTTKVLTAVEEAPKIDVGSPDSWPLSQYAMEHFQRIKGKGMMNTLKRKQLGPDRLLSYHKRGITAPMHANIKPEAAKVCVQLFKRLTMFINRKVFEGETDPMENAQAILAKGIADPDVRAEVYCHAIAQTRNNSEGTEIKAWEMLCFLCGTFLPDEALLNYVVAYVQQHTEGSGKVGQLARSCETRLARVRAKGARVQYPGKVELQAVADCKQILCRFSTLDGNVKAMFVDSSTTAAEVFPLLSEKLGLQDPAGFAIYEVYNRLERSLEDEDNICDALGKFEKFSAMCRRERLSVNFKMVFKMKLCLDPALLSDDDVENQLMSVQAYADIMAGKLPVPEETAKTLAALRAQEDMGDEAANKPLNKENMKLYCPPQYYRDSIVTDWERDIRKEWGRYKRLDKTQAQIKYLQVGKTLPLYGHTFYNVEHKTAWALPAKFVMSINVEGIHFLENDDQRTKINTYFFDQITNMRAGPRSLTLFLGVSIDDPSPKVLEVITMSGVEMISLITGYAFWLRLESPWCRATVDNEVDDPELLDYVAGELINIIDRDEESGWYKGYIEPSEPGEARRQGMFHRENVVVLLTPPGNQRPRSYSKARRRSSVTTSTGRRSSNAPAPVLRERRSSFAMPAPEVAAVNAGEYPLVKYAADFFVDQLEVKASKKKKTVSKLTSSGLLGGKGGGGKTTVITDKAEMLRFSKDPLKSSLLKELSAAGQKEAAQLCVRLMKYMGDYPCSSNTDLLVGEIGDRIATWRELQDEVFCQVLKQINGNPRREAQTKGFELLSLLAGVVTPSERFKPYLFGYLQEQAKSSNDTTIKSLCEDALKRFARTIAKGSRRRGPCKLELEAVRDGKPLAATIFTYDGTSKTVASDSASIVGDVLRRFCDKVSISDRDGWGLYEVLVTQDRERLIDPAENLCDVMRSWEMDKDGAMGGQGPGPGGLGFIFLFKRRILLEPRSKAHVESDSVRPLLFATAVHDVLTGLMAVEEQDALELGGLALQAKLGEVGASKLTSSADLGQYLGEFVPGYLATKHDAGFWCQQLWGKWAAHKGVSQKDAQVAYLTKCHEWELYGATIFPVHFAKNPKIDLIAINENGVSLLSRGKREPLEQFAYADISNWTSGNYTKHPDGRVTGEPTFSMTVGDLMKPVLLVFGTMIPSEIASALQSYVDALVLKKRREDAAKRPTAPGGRRRAF